MKPFLVLIFSVLLLNSQAWAQDYDSFTPRKKAEILYDQAWKYLNNGEQYLAIDCLKQCLKVDHESFEAFNLLGKIYTKLGKDAEAKIAYKKSLSINEDQLEIKDKYRFLARLRIPEDKLQELEGDEWWYGESPEEKIKKIEEAGVYVEIPASQVTPLVSKSYKGL